ncbi:MAG: hypothetical protein ABIR70_21315 [Bryobacteraceae bacterium]
MQPAPSLPEGLVSRTATQHALEFPRVTQANVVAQHVAEQMQRGNAKTIDIAELRHVFDSFAPIPKRIHAGRGNAVSTGTPNRVMQLNGDGLQRIEIVALPVPRVRFQHRAGVIVGQLGRTVKNKAVLL